MRFRLVAPLIFGFFFVYLAVSLVWPLGGLARVVFLVLLAAPFAAIFWVVFRLLGGDRRNPPRLARPVQTTAHWGLGLLNYLALVTLVRDFASIFVPRSLRTPQVSADLIVLGFLLFGLGYVGARYSVSVKRVEVPIDKLPPSLRGFRIVQISDLHVSPGIRRPYVERVVALANGCDADVVVLTGDIADGSLAELRADAEPLARLRARHARYYVTGNHEYYWDAPPWVRAFTEMGLKPLLNEREILRVKEASIAFGGVPDVAAPLFGLAGPDVANVFGGLAHFAGPKILLSHQTKVADEAERQGVQLLISGHTHGGQFFPWTWVVSYIDRFAHGLRRLGAMQVYVSRGTGYWGPPVRLGSPPEVTLLVLVEKKDERASTAT